MAILYQYGEAWRVIWTDGRQLPKLVDGGVLVGKEVREPRFYGYSVGKWEDDTTLVVQTVGMMPEDKVWLDGTGRPVSDQVRVEERFHRVNHDRLELTVTIDDPKMYTKPWIAMNKFPMRLQDPHFDVTEMYCSPSEMEKYNKLFGDPTSEPASAPDKPHWPIDWAGVLRHLESAFFVRAFERIVELNVRIFAGCGGNCHEREGYSGIGPGGRSPVRVRAALRAPRNHGV